MMVTPVYVLVRELGFVCPCAAARGVCVCVGVAPQDTMEVRRYCFEGTLDIG